MGTTDLDTILNFIAHDTPDFDPEEFIKTWPNDPSDQNLVLAMLTVRSSKNLAKLQKNSNSMWSIVTICVVLAAVGAAHAVGIDNLYAVMGALIAGAIAQLFKIGAA